MSSPLADQLDSVWAEARSIFADAFHTDVYQIVRSEQVEDGYGGSSFTENVVEEGRCVLEVRNIMGGERQTAGGSLMTTVSRYSVTMPIASVVKTDDTLIVNGRRFDVKDVKRGGDWGLFANVDVEEVMS